MQTSELIPGATYAIESIEGDGKPWRGLATYVGPETSGIYPDGALGFICEDGISGVFMPDEVQALAQHQGSLTDQLNELHRIATKLKLYDAADWIRQNGLK